jgi:hypothetical protein
VTDDIHFAKTINKKRQNQKKNEGRKKSEEALWALWDGIKRGVERVTIGRRKQRAKPALLKGRLGFEEGL